MRIIGIDISGGFATAVLLDSQPENLLSYYHSEKYTPFDFEPTHEHLEALISLEPDCVAWEPTGTHYELVYRDWFKKHGVEVKRIAAKRVASYRNDSGLDKTDGTDALAIASYTLKRYDDPSAFIQECELEEMRHLYLQRHGLIKIQRRYCQRLRLQLHHEFPEAADTKLNARLWGERGAGLVSWLSDNGSNRSNTRWTTLYEGGVRNKNRVAIKKTINPTIGTGISDYSKWLAKHIWEIWEQCREIEERFEQELAKPEFKPYIEAFDAVGFSMDCKVIWLTRIYPFDKFLKDGRENCIRRLNSKGKLCKYNLSLSQFKASVGAGTIRNESGQKSGKNVRMSDVRRK
ncbi:MAG: transposase, partial [Cyanobacteria bacterium J06659_2]